jgi:AraC-like DNA-binding protein
MGKAGENYRERERSLEILNGVYQEDPHDYFLPPFSPLATLETLEDLRKRIVYSRRLERLWIFIEEFYSDPDIRLKDAAKRSGVSQDHLNHLLRRFADTTFRDLLARYRIEKCLELFYERNYTVTEIYTRCGFNSPTTFDRQFKRWVGCLPREYKSRVTNKRPPT